MNLSIQLMKEKDVDEVLHISNLSLKESWSRESLLKEVPMIVPYFIPGQEEENLDFLSNCGASLRTSKKYTLGIILKVLIDNPDRIDMAKQNIRSIKKLNASQDIAKLAFDVLSDEK